VSKREQREREGGFFLSFSLSFDLSTSTFSLASLLFFPSFEPSARARARN